MLLRGVREVASIADAENPIQVSQRRFDDARRLSRTFADLPKARDIAWRLRMPWREVLLLAHAHASTHGADRVSLPTSDHGNSPGLTG
jgi:hypothetical protein